MKKLIYLSFLCFFTLFGCDSGKKKMLIRPSEPPAPMLVPSDIAIPLPKPQKKQDDIADASPLLNVDATDVTIEKKQPKLLAASSENPMFHLCKSGDTIKNVVEKYKIDANKLMKLNNLTPAQQLIPGKILLMPRASGDLATSDQVATYTVVKGDTFSRIARHFHISVVALMKLNNAKDSNLDIGDVLYVPKLVK